MGKETPTHQRTLLASIFCILVKIEFSSIQDAWAVLHAESISLILSATFVYRKKVTNYPTGVVNEMCFWVLRVFTWFCMQLHRELQNYKRMNLFDHREWLAKTPAALKFIMRPGQGLMSRGLALGQWGAWQRHWRACSYAVKGSLRGHLAWGIPSMAWLNSPQTSMAIWDTST